MITFDGANRFGKEHLVQCNLQFDVSFGSFQLKSTRIIDLGSYSG